MLELLGWRFSKKPERRLPFSRSFDVLGVVVDPSASDRGKVVTRNKLDRVDGIVAQVDEIVPKALASSRLQPPFEAAFSSRRASFMAERSRFALPHSETELRAMTMFRSCVSR